MIKGSTREAHEEFARTLLQLRSDAGRHPLCAQVGRGMIASCRGRHQPNRTKKPTHLSAPNKPIAKRPQTT